MKNNYKNSSSELQYSKVCPKCMGSKNTFNGKKITSCSLCKKKGVVNEDTYNYFIRDIDTFFNIT